MRKDHDKHEILYIILVLTIIFVLMMLIIAGINAYNRYQLQFTPDDRRETNPYSYRTQSSNGKEGSRHPKTLHMHGCDCTRCS